LPRVCIIVAVNCARTWVRDNHLEAVEEYYNWYNHINSGEIIELIESDAVWSFFLMIHRKNCVTHTVNAINVIVHAIILHTGSMSQKRIYERRSANLSSTMDLIAYWLNGQVIVLHIHFPLILKYSVQKLYYGYNWTSSSNVTKRISGNYFFDINNTI